MEELLSLQGSIFLLMIAGLVMKKTGIVGETGQKNMTDLVLNLILPCNIIRSFQIEFSWKTMHSFGTILVVSICIQLGCMVLGKLLFGRMSRNKWKCLYYGTVCSNAGFLGNPIAEGVFGSQGLALASIYLIPQRIVMWSSGISVFSGSRDVKALVKKVLTHPCIIACFIGIFLMLTQLSLPGMVQTTINSLANCNTAMSMMVVGIILADLKLREMADPTVLLYSAVRLILIPVLVLIPCSLLGLDSMVTGVSVLLAAMPAGATTSILAAKYDADPGFATKMIIMSTLASVFTTPVWSFFLG